jgi:MFS family permease
MAQNALVTEKSRLPREIWVLVAAAFVIAIGYGLISPVLPAYARSFDVGVAAASVIVSAFAFFRLVFAPAGGALIGRLGERPVYLIGLLIVAVSTGASAFAHDYAQLLIYRGLGGIGSTMFTVSAMALLVRMTPPGQRGRTSSLYSSAFLLGGMLGPALGGALAGFGMRVPFIVYAIALLVAAGVVATFLRSEPTAAVSEGPARVALRVREAFRSRGYRAALVGAFANGCANFGVRAAVIPQFVVVVHKGAWVAGAALAVSAVGTAITLQLSGPATDRIGRRPLVLAGLLVTATSFVFLGLAHSLPLLFAMCTLEGIGAGMINPGQQATVADVIGQERSGGKALAAFQMCQDAGAIIGPVAIGFVADRIGFGWAFTVAAAVSALAALAWLDPAAETSPLRADARSARGKASSVDTDDGGVAVAHVAVGDHHDGPAAVE